MKKAFFISCGSVSLGLGIIGIILPLLPTTPFLLLTAACYAKSSERLYQWLLENKYFGSYIKNYRAGKGIPLKAKITAVSVLWLSLSFTIFFIIPLVAVKILLALIGAYITGFILKQKTLQKHAF
ncbi:YbaN family protein [Oceanobacillus jeddahense]|uniref:YbaN family protein n=1 Tax=Oceanobacillus jeddahense TaxID=1462527 RepID=A0ABY5JTP6_9BACI|nr:YbaN family protein [Oceanobacillus jeddahense]UUI02847.1 YbaN family protein [Oceanobacillus jeddahense]